MSNLNFLHSGGNKVIISAPDSNPASDRTLKLPSNADGTIITSTSPDADRFKAGEIVQVVTQEFAMSTGTFTNGTYTSLSSTGLTSTITPRFSNSKIIYDTQITCNVNDDDGHTDGRYMMPQMQEYFIIIHIVLVDILDLIPIHTPQFIFDVLELR